MAWNATTLAKQRKHFILAWQTERYSKAQLCKQFNISRPTGDKWLKRYLQEGDAGLENRSRAPKTNPNKTPQEICDLLIAAKHKYPHMGPRRLLAILQAEHPDLKLPSVSTGDLILKRAGLVKPRAKNPNKADNKR